MIIRGVNDGTAIITNVEITSILPHEFKLLGFSRLPVGSKLRYHNPDGYFFNYPDERRRTVGLKWIFDEINPKQEVEIRFKIRASREYDPLEVYKMLRNHFVHRLPKEQDIT